MDKPVRIQRKRIKGWRMPPNTVSVTRPGPWGNQYYPLSGHSRGRFTDDMLPVANGDVRDPVVQVRWFREWLTELRDSQPGGFEQFVGPIRGKNLACWCALDQPCHADVLLELANAQPESA